MKFCVIEGIKISNRMCSHIQKNDNSEKCKTCVAVGRG